MTMELDAGERTGTTDFRRPDAARDVPSADATATTSTWSSRLRSAWHAVRSTSEAIAAPLGPEDAAAQSMPDASPVKWHLAHTTWFFETFILSPHVAGYASPQPAFRALFNSYYNAVGAQFPRPRRGLLTRPDLPEVMRYRRAIDRAIEDWLDGLPDAGPAPALADLFALGLQHEQQHQELMLTDLKHLLSCNPLAPAYRVDLRTARGGPRSAAAPRWRAFAGGVNSIGEAAPPTGALALDGGFSFDNERPRHRVCVAPFELADRPVSHGEVRAFVEAGGYADPRWWMSDGWAWRQSTGLEAPLYWQRDAGGDRAGGWLVFTLGGLRPVDDAAPACHLSWYEADAVARWAGARLPTEAEWEHAARLAGGPWTGPTVNDLACDALHPLPAGAAATGDTRLGTPGGSDPAAGGTPLLQMAGDVWEWTGSAFLPYPGFRAAAGAVGEYNGKFMCNQFVLRGGSCVTPRGHARPGYRNFFGPDKAWQFSGLRLARTLPG